MAPPSAKRQRRLVLSSDDEGQADDDCYLSRPTSPPRQQTAKQQSQLPSRSKTRSTTSKSIGRTKTVLNSSPDTSPTKRKRDQKAAQANVQSNSLHTFFRPATEDERWNRREKVVDANEQAHENREDQIEDGSSDEGTSIATGPRSNQRLPLDRRKTGGDTSSLSEPTGKIQAPPNGSQRFAKDSNLAPRPTVASNTHRTWAERFPPETLDELALHKKKESDVQRCLLDMLDGRISQRLLILKGPAGSGKSTIVSLLSRVLNFTIVEWKNPDTSERGIGTSMAAQLDDFLNRGGHFANLSVDPQETKPPSQASDESSGRRIILIEEFPSSISGSSSALQAFRNTLLRFLSSTSLALPPKFRTSNSATNRQVVIIVVSEALLSSALSVSEAFTAHRLLGPDIMNHPKVSAIEFNPTAPTFVTKALELVLKKEARSSRRRRIPGPAVIKKLSEKGDIRSAINSLEFLCLRGDEDGAWSGRTAAVTKKSEKSGITLTDIERESLGLLNQREATLGMFHAVGKVVYNKRDPADQNMGGLIQPPEHLKHFARYSKPQTSVDDLMDEIGTDILTFIATLHENYALSCRSSSFVDTFADCSEQISNADILSSDRSRTKGRFEGSLSRNSTTDAIRQSEISFQAAVRGLLFSLPSPVSRADHPKGRKADSFKMFFPTSLRLWKLIEEVDGLVDQWLFRLIGRQKKYSSDSSEDVNGGVASWKSWTRALERPLEDSNSGELEQIRILVSKDDLLMERIPYLKHIIAENGQMKHDINRITTFAGLGLQENEELDGGDPLTEAIPKNKHPRNMLAHQNVGVPRDDVNKEIGKHPDDKMEKLYISDDDIED
ncbi:MAG: hypothetical protein Q9160_002493 [Pyrenula sp. 1 TL-2023]